MEAKREVVNGSNSSSVIVVFLVLSQTSILVSEFSVETSS